MADIETQRWKLIHDQLDGLLSVVATAKDGTRIKTLKPSADILVTQLAAATATNDVSERDRIGASLQELWTVAEDWSGVSRKPFFDRLWEQFSVPALFGAAALIVTFWGVGIFIWSYVSQAGWSVLQTVQGTRPILVLAAVVATLTYGGGLLFSALFSSEGKFEDRFRMAREIFLVFSGVFATVVGFHFGQGNETRVGAPGQTTVVVSSSSPASVASSAASNAMSSAASDAVSSAASSPVVPSASESSDSSASGPSHPAPAAAK